MYCTECGSKLLENAAFCSSCGAALNAKTPHATPATQETQPAPTAQEVQAAPAVQEFQFTPAVQEIQATPVAQEIQATPNKHRPRKALRFGILGLVLAAFAVGGFYVYSLIAPALALGNAMSGFAEEVNQRLDASPLAAFRMLNEASQDGVISGSFDFWYEWDNFREGGSVRLDLHSNRAANEYALLGSFQIRDDWSELDLSTDFQIHLSPQRAAFGLGLFDNQLYGFNFPTFRQDFHNFGRLIGLDEFMINQISDAVASLEEFLQPAAQNAENRWQQYIDLVSAFFRDNMGQAQDITIMQNNHPITVSRHEIIITRHLIASLLEDFHRLLSNDHQLRSMFDSTPGMFDDMLWELRMEIDELRNPGPWSPEIPDMIIAMYVGTGQRLSRLTFFVEDRYETTEFTLDLGTSVFDTWTLDVAIEDRWSYIQWGGEIRHESHRFIWEFFDAGAEYVNRFTMMLHIGRWDDNIALILRWNPSTGRFVFEYRDDWSSQTLFEGNFTKSNGGFNLAFEYDSGWGETMNFRLSARPGANIPRPSFIGVERWDQALLDRLEQQFDELYDDLNQFFGFGGSTWESWWSDSHWSLSWGLFDLGPGLLQEIIQDGLGIYWWLSWQDFQNIDEINWIVDSLSIWDWEFILWSLPSQGWVDDFVWRLEWHFGDWIWNEISIPNFNQPTTGNEQTWDGWDLFHHVHGFNDFISESGLSTNYLWAYFDWATNDLVIVVDTDRYFFSDSVAFDWDFAWELEWPAWFISTLIQAGYPINITIEGHTDNVPSAAFTNNRALSAAKANEILWLFASDWGYIPSDRITAIGHGEFRPIDTNDIPEGRANNRRIEIRITAE